MSQATNEPGNNDADTNKDPDYVPHDPGGDDLSTMIIESEEPSGDDEPGGKTGDQDPDPEPGDDDNPGDDPAKNKSATDESDVFIYDDKAFSPEGSPTETETEKAQRLQILELQQQLEQRKPADNQPPAELKEPGLYDTGIDGDQDKYAAAMKAYGIEVGKREAAAAVEQHKQDQRRQQETAIYENNVKNYDTRRAAVKATLPDIDQADLSLSQSLPHMHQAAIMAAGLENPEMVVYALYKNKELRDKLAAENNPIRIGIMLADISKKSRLAPKGEKPPASKEPEVKGSQGSNPKGNGLSKEFASAQFE